MENKRIGFVTIRNIFAITSLPRYIDSFGENKFDIIYWDRQGINESCGAENHYAMDFKIKNTDSKLRKLLGYLKFIKFTRSILKSNKYDKLIILPTQTGILFERLLKRKYAGKYIIDIRDYTAENNKFFYKKQNRLIKNSGLAVITSPAFKRFLPEHDYIQSHNIAYVPSTLIKEYRDGIKPKEKRIVISCIGGIRFYEQFRRVIDCFKNDNRYLLKFIGNGSEELEIYCEENNVRNVELVGWFAPEKTLDFYMETDIIMNLYGNNNPLLDYALSNKLYYGATLGMPVLVSPNTYMAEVSVDNGFGYTFDLWDKNERDKLYDYYHTIDWSRFYNNCDEFMKNVYSDNVIFENSVRNFIEADKI